MGSEELIPQAILRLGLHRRGIWPWQGTGAESSRANPEHHLSGVPSFPLWALGAECQGTGSAWGCSGSLWTAKTHTSLLQTLNLFLMFWRSRISSAQGGKAQRGMVERNQRKHLKLCPGFLCRWMRSSQPVFSTGPFLFFLCLIRLFLLLGYGIMLHLLSGLGLHTKYHITWSTKHMHLIYSYSNGPSLFTAPCRTDS